jgi:hydrogenase maturation protein HypF
MNDVAKKVTVNGVVQGVGFRPFVYQLAKQHRLNGRVANTSAGVVIHIEGPKIKFDAFIKDLPRKCPPLAQIVEISSTDQAYGHYTEFKIDVSQNRAGMETLISPDISVCADCLTELFNPNDRRFRYPFINCTNCGPRYTIIDDIPYDRPKTSMKRFHMCPACRAEYDDPDDRRFHAQPNACAACGPRVDLFDKNRQPVDAQDPIKKTALLLKQGYIVAIKGLGGFHLAADAQNSAAAKTLRRRKAREEKPLAIMAANIEKIRKFAEITPQEEIQLKSPQRPIVLLQKKEPNPITDEVAPKNRCFGAMLPYTPLHYLLLEHDFTALIMTSANRSEEPISIDNDDAFQRLSNIADYFLVHNRDIYLRNDDSIVKRIAGQLRFIRRSRGYVPVPVFLKAKVPPILACGAELKNTVCLTKKKQAFISQHIGDLENIPAYECFTKTIAHMQRILDVTPEITAFDMHPNYLSTRYAEALQDLEKVPVQHHHAHIVSCMTENRIDGPVIGLSFDGTGYGTDGHVWGGEVLVADALGFKRMAHLAYVPMPGGDAAIRQPWRMAVSYLYETFGNGCEDLGLPLFKKIDAAKVDTIKKMIRNRFNSPYTSSLGRLYDGVAAMIGLRDQVGFEGQAAMELEMIAADKPAGIYDYEWTSADPRRVLFQPMIGGIVRDVLKRTPKAKISSKFHGSLIRLFTDLCGVISKETGLKRVVLSGGAFQNSILLSGLIQSLTQKNLQVLTHKLVPPNDGGISLGQAMVAAAKAGGLQGRCCR